MKRIQFYLTSCAHNPEHVRLTLDLLACLSACSVVTASMCKVRVGPDPNSRELYQLKKKKKVKVLEQAICDGHQRGKIGPAEWISLTTAQGKVLAMPATQKPQPL
jgi:hypothetical protein|eukprot:COSAG02_NODE_1226_length_13781_cov_2000.919828_2_plen_105_part_00